MIIASPNAQPVPTAGKADAADGARDADQGFDRILAQRLNRGGTDDVAQGDGVPVDAKSPTGPDGKPLATTSGSSTTDPAAAATIDGAAQRNAVATTKAKPTADEKDDDTAGNDLAAQLALVSQWAALPPAASAKSGGDAQVDGRDIQGKLATVRATAATATSTLASDALEQTQAAAVPWVASTTQQGFDRTLRTAGSTTGAVTKAADPKAQDDAKTVAVGERLSLAEVLLGKVDAGGARGSTDPTTLANAFVTQVAAQAANAQAVAAAPTPAQLRETVGTPAWSHEVGQATLRLAASDLQGASLRLNPEHLGPLDVQVRIDNGVAHLSFAAAHAQTRQAIESSRTTLDQLFQNQGLKIGDCAVGDSSAQRRFDADGPAQGGARRDGGRWGEPDAVSVDTTIATVAVRRALGLVDTFA